MMMTENIEINRKVKIRRLITMTNAIQITLKRSMAIIMTIR